MSAPIEHSVILQPLHVSNGSRADFTAAVKEIPYLLYEVENLKNGDKIVINKPGSKKNFNKIAEEDYMVFIYSPAEGKLWLISHAELGEDLDKKFADDEDTAEKVLRGLYRVCLGEEPDDVLRDMRLGRCTGLDPETIFKVYKWIWGQEDCNYPDGKGRWLSMEGYLRRYGVQVN